MFLWQQNSLHWNVTSLPNYYLLKKDSIWHSKLEEQHYLFVWILLKEHQESLLPKENVTMKLQGGSIIEIDAALDISTELQYCRKENMQSLGEFMQRTFSMLSKMICWYGPGGELRATWNQWQLIHSARLQRCSGDVFTIDDWRFTIPIHVSRKSKTHD